MGMRHRKGMGVEIAFAVMLLVGLVVLFWMIVRSSSQKITKQYAKLAARFELELTECPPKMLGLIRPEPFVHGHFRGREMSISAPGSGLQKSRQIETQLKVELGDKRLGCQMTSAGVFGSMRQRDSRAKERWTSGDADFDTAVDLRTNNPSIVARVLTPDRRERLCQLLKVSKAMIYVHNGIMIYSTLGLIANDADAERFIEAAELFYEIADAVEN